MLDVVNRLEALERERREHASLKCSFEQLKLENEKLQSRVSELEKELSKLKSVVNTSTTADSLSHEQSSKLWSALFASNALSSHSTTSSAETDPNATSSDHNSKLTSAEPLSKLIDKVCERVRDKARSEESRSGNIVLIGVRASSEFSDEQHIRQIFRYMCKARQNIVSYRRLR